MDTIRVTKSDLLCRREKSSLPTNIFIGGLLAMLAGGIFSQVWLLGVGFFVMAIAFMWMNADALDFRSLSQRWNGGVCRFSSKREASKEL